jgi:hypothetical protein
VSPEGVAPGLRITATAWHPEIGELVEGLESEDPGRWLIGIQCHPERVDSSPPVFVELWRSFVAAAAARAVEGEATGGEATGGEPAVIGPRSGQQRSAEQQR